MKKKKVLRVLCPTCGKFEFVGCSGYNRYFCSRCFIQFRIIPNKNKKEQRVVITTSDEDGREIFIDDYIEPLNV